MSSLLPTALLYLPLSGNQSVQVMAFDVVRQPYGTDTARLLIYNYSNKLLDQIIPGSPVRFYWGSGAGLHLIYGYIYEAKPTVNELQRTLEIIIVGMQHPMAWLNRTRSFPRTGPHNVVAEIVDDYRFVAHIAPAPVQEIPDQKDVSDWQFLSDLGRELGYVLLSIGSEIVFAPIDGYWKQSIKNQNYAATFRETMTQRANLKSFERIESSLFTLIDKGITSPFDTELNFVQFTNNTWTGSKAFDVFATLFPSSATAVLLNPGEIYPLDAFDVTIDVSRTTWTALQVKYVLRLDDYYAELVLGGNGLLYSTSNREAYDISTALHWRQSTTSRPPLLVTTDQIRRSSYLSAHWEAPLVNAPGTKEESWLIGL